MNINEGVIEKGIERFGGNKQMLKCVEEMSELSAIVIKQSIHPEKNLKLCIADELADVYITLHTLKMILDIPEWEIDHLIRSKQDRFNNHLDTAYSSLHGINHQH